MSTRTDVEIVSVGSAVPDTTLTNKDLEKILDTSDEWITTRTGIRTRHVFPESERDQARAYELGGKAAAAALKAGGVTPEQIDGVICATFTPDFFFPSTACKIQEYLGIPPGCAFDLSAACAGFVYAMAVAESLIRCGPNRTMLLVGTEIISKTIDWEDRSTAILFGDAAGAMVLRGREGDGERGILASHLSSCGSLGNILSLPAWGEKRTMKMNGGEVFKHAVRMMSEATRVVTRKCGIDTNQLDLLIPHQANVRILNAIATSLSIPREKLICNVDRYGNTSSASIPLALEEAWKAGKIQDGTLVAFTSLGGGVSLAAALARF